MMSALGFKARVDPFACFLTCVILRSADCIEVSMAAKPFRSMYLQMYLQALELVFYRIYHFVMFTGEVYTWGDNDEGQLGDGTTNAIPRPRLVAALQGKLISWGGGFKFPE